jgi:hypothetical protein
LRIPSMGHVVLSSFALLIATATPRALLHIVYHDFSKLQAPVPAPAQLAGVAIPP